jgi:SAM-dependent methyltransferase
MDRTPQTWHHGLVARWWAEFNTDGPEIAYFQRFIEGGGQPALDVACGTGRLLLPYLRAGLDVDGCDISDDMIALCREQAAREGRSPTLFVQPMHELDPPRTYRTIIVCGGFGIGSTREQDLEALSRFHACLEPGGTLILDKEVPYANRLHWRFWLKDERDSLPEAWRAPGKPRPLSDGDELSLRTRLLDADPLLQRVTWQIQASLWRAGTPVAEEERTLTENFYSRNELLLMLERAGFDEVAVRGDHTDEEPTGTDDFLVFIAGKPLAVRRRA